MVVQPRRKWWHIQWYADTDTPEERKLINKLDLLIVPYAVLSYWVKYIDQSNLNNAYVAGLKEDLGFKGNELVQLQTLYIVGAVTGQLPMMFILTYVPIHWLIPFLDIAWGIFTLLQYRVTGFAELAAYRFLVGWFEAAFFPVMHYLFGSWYRGDEIARRGGIFYVGLSLGTLTAGLIQAGASARLDGVHGLAGWRWMYIICSLITVPIGILGYFVIPGTPEQPNRLFLKRENIELSVERLKRAGHSSHGKFKLGNLKKVFFSWQFWGIVVVDVLFWNASIHTSSGSFLLWIKSLSRYSAAKVNELGTIAPALGIFYTLFVCFASDLVIGPAWAITLASAWNALGLLILVIWNVPEAAKWFAFSTIYASVAMSSVFHGWVNTQLRSSPAERSFTLVLINAISQSSTAWTPLLVFPTVEAPRYRKGFAFTLACAVLLIVATHILRMYIKRRDPQLENATGFSESDHEDISTVENGKQPPVAQTYEMTSVPIHSSANGENGVKPEGKKQILLNAFDMSTVGHLSPGQWKNPTDKSATKRDLNYWIDLAKLLERGGINALFLADTYGGYDTYEGSLDNCIRRAAQWPMTDPTIPISAMAAVTKNLTFAITASTSFEPPFLLAKRFSTLDHFTRGRIGWNIVTSWKKAAFKAIGLDSPIPHDERYAQADEYLRVLYKLWEGSWADDAITPDPENDSYADPDKIRTIHHHGKFFDLDTRHIVDPSPQRTPFLFQAGTSAAGSEFAATHAEGIFVSSHSPKLLRPKVKQIREKAAALGRDPQSVKFFATFTPIVGRTDEEAQAKHEELKKYASVIGGLVLVSGWTGIDLSKIPVDQEVTAADSLEAHKVRSILDAFTTTSEHVPKWTPRVIAERAAIGGLGPVSVGSPQKVADDLEYWIREGDLDGFNLGYVTTPGTFEDVVDLLIPELRRRGIYPEAPAEDVAFTAREKVYGQGQKGLRADHPGSSYKYDVYKEDADSERANSSE
ncbi:HK97 family phage prohead protease [Colletotrichum orchidophilum]|uniref:HK97 family phage prohead protease n=1 Tax=Colletotrichum orchidophilum TaxID=1209926 RepID=A0A1G4AXD8_9PEZI|nr:HK97 family phage prohead protease [Colletotrichum orchidophilum]OHE93828.1 HK97 family phage prohead protease [Colletotrichum orchidophilum]